MTRTIAMIPGRIGSMRLKMKNLALLGGKPLMSYAIQAAVSAGVFDRVVVNGDHEIFSEIAGQYGAEFYLRPAELGSSTTKSDHVVYDFMQKYPGEAVAWVNPTSPLQTADEIRGAVNDFWARQLDSLMTVREERVHGLVGHAPVNFNPDEVFAQTQDLSPVQLFVYSVMMWRTSTFLSAFEQRGYALLSGKVGYYPVSRFAGVLIKTPEDLQLAEALLPLITAQAQERPVQYDRRVEAVKGAPV